MEAEGSPATVLVTSTKDEASTTIAKGLLKNHGFESTEISAHGEAGLPEWARCSW